MILLAPMTVWLMCPGDSNSYPGIAGEPVEVLRILLFPEMQTVFSTNRVLTFLPVVCSHSLVRSRSNSLSSSR